MKDFVMVKGNEFTHKGYAEMKGHLNNGAKTILEAFMKNVSERPKQNVIGTIVNDEIRFKTFEELDILMRKLGAFLESVTDENEIVGIYSINRVEWIIAEYATYFAHCINAPLYSTFSSDSLAHVINETEMKIVIASAATATSLIEGSLSKTVLPIKHIILMDKDEKTRNLCSNEGYKITYLSDIFESDEIPALTRSLPIPENLASICYTSGTSGTPKGVTITHKSIISQVEAFMIGSEKYDIIKFKLSDVYISYLPLAHVLERIVFTLCFVLGSPSVFYRGNPKNLLADIVTIKPSFITMVPRVLNVFYDRIKQGVDSQPFYKRWVFKIGLRWKLFMQQFGYQHSWFWDTFIFSGVSSRFGGQLRASLCGGASVNPDVIRYLQAVLSIKIFQGYGQTEGIGANILSTMDSTDCASVGIPFVSTRLKLEKDDDLPGSSMHLLMKGPAITSGYYKRESLNKEAFDKDGWLITGDVVKYEDGCFYMVGRSKDIFKTSFGEYITPEVLENVFTGGIIEDVYITHHAFSDYLLALVVCTDENITLQDVINKIKERGAHLVSERKICRYEIPSHFVLIRKPFSAYENENFMTPSMKKRRKIIEKYFAEEIANGFKTKC